MQSRSINSGKSGRYFLSDTSVPFVCAAKGARHSRSFDRSSVAYGFDIGHLLNCRRLPVELPELLDRLQDFVDHRNPIPRRLLAKDSDRRIPRRIGPVLKPAPAALNRQHQKRRSAHRADQMRYGRISRDHKIERLDPTGGVKKVERPVLVEREHLVRRAETVDRDIVEIADQGLLTVGREALTEKSDL